jgi:phosphoglycolate phosphatase
MRERYLAHYETCLTENTAPFAGMAELLDALDNAGTRWGVVTNKPGYLAEPLLAALDLASRCASIVSGDTLPQRKPHPAPLLHAAKEAGVSAGGSVYIGDDRRDIEAGRAAGMTTIAAGYGYITPDENPADWGADHLVSEIGELTELLRRQGCLGVS